MSLAFAAFEEKSRLRALLDHLSVIDDPRDPRRVAVQFPDFWWGFWDSRRGGCVRRYVLFRVARSAACNNEGRPTNRSEPHAWGTSHETVYDDLCGDGYA